MGLEKGPKRLPGSVQSDFDRIATYGEERSHFFCAELLDVPQEQDRSVVLGELCRSSFERGPGFHPAPADPSRSPTSRTAPPDDDRFRRTWKERLDGHLGVTPAFAQNHEALVHADMHDGQLSSLA